jgi:hypothetical protein
MSAFLGTPLCKFRSHSKGTTLIMHEHLFMLLCNKIWLSNGLHTCGAIHSESVHHLPPILSRKWGDSPPTHTCVICATSKNYSWTYCKYRLGRVHHRTTLYIPHSSSLSSPCTPSTSLMGTCCTRRSYDGRPHMGDSTSPGACRPPPASHIIEIVYSSRTFTRPCLPIILLLL